MSNGDVQEEALEKAYWDFDADSKKSGMERDAFKRQMRGYSSALRKENITLHAENAALREELSQNFDLLTGLPAYFEKDTHEHKIIKQRIRKTNEILSKSLPVTAEGGGA